MTRTGKIARLPYSIRGLLNERLRNGEPATKILEWLNALPKVQEVLEEHFGGRPVSEQNVSEWRSGGYEDWLAHQQTLDWLRNLIDEAGDLEEEAGAYSVADWLSAPIAVALCRCFQHILPGAEADENKRRALLAISREICELRRVDHQEERIRLDRERWEAEEAEAEAKKRSAAKMSPLWALLAATGVGELYKDRMKDGHVPPEVEAFLAVTGKGRPSAAESHPPGAAPGNKANPTQ